MLLEKAIPFFVFFFKTNLDYVLKIQKYLKDRSKKGAMLSIRAELSKKYKRMATSFFFFLNNSYYKYMMDFFYQSNIPYLIIPMSSG